MPKKIIIITSILILVALAATISVIWWENSQEEGLTHFKWLKQLKILQIKSPNKTLNQQQPFPNSAQTSGSTTETYNVKPGSPSEATISFFNYLMRKNYSEAKKMLAPNLLDFINSKGGLQKIWEENPNSKKVAKITIIREEPLGETAKVWFTGYDAKGEKLNGEWMTDLTKIEGKWKLDKSK